MNIIGSNIGNMVWFVPDHMTATTRHACVHVPIHIRHGTETSFPPFPSIRDTTKTPSPSIPLTLRVEAKQSVPTHPHRPLVSILICQIDEILSPPLLAPLPYFPGTIVQHIVYLDRCSKKKKKRCQLSEGPGQRPIVYPIDIPVIAEQELPSMGPRRSLPLTDLLCLGQGRVHCV